MYSSLLQTGLLISNVLTVYKLENNDQEREIQIDGIQYRLDKHSARIAKLEINSEKVILAKKTKELLQKQSRETEKQSSTQKAATLEVETQRQKVFTKPNKTASLSMIFSNPDISQQAIATVGDNRLPGLLLHKNQIFPISNEIVSVSLILMGVVCLFGLARKSK